MEAAIHKYISSKTIISPYDIINDLMPRFYPVSDIVLDAAKYFTTIIKRKDFCVEQDKLVKYGILSLFENGQPKASDILRLMNQYGLAENVDYLMAQRCAIKFGTYGGHRKPTIEYTMTPKTFFLCLIRSKNSSEYAMYYFHVLEIYDYYEQYFTQMYKENIEDLKNDLHSTNEELSEVEKDRDSLEDKLDKLMAKMDKQTLELQKQNEELQTQTLELQNQTQEMKIQHEESKQQMGAMQDTLNKIVKKLDDRAVPPPDDELTERFALMKKNDNTFYVIRSQERRIRKAIKEKEKLGYSKVPDLLESESIPNSMYLWNCIKVILKTENKIYCFRNEVTLKNISEVDLIQVINQVFDSRREVN